MNEVPAEIMRQILAQYEVIYIRLTAADLRRVEMLADKYGVNVSYVVQELIRDAYVREGLGQLDLDE